MSNRFHPKWHRKNHHTYGNDTNPDASHDPIASREQPFRGDFILSGSLSGTAPLSAFAAYFYSSNTALSAFAGKRGAYIYSTGDLGIEVQSTARTAISAYGKYIGVEATSDTIAISANAPVFGMIVSSNTRSISSYGGLIGLEVGSGMRSISAYGGFIGAEIGSSNIGLSSYGQRTAGIFLSNGVSLSTNSINDGYPDRFNPYFGPNYTSKNVLNNRTGIFTENPLSAFHVTGGSLFDGHVSITGNLSVAGDLTRIDTYVFITSSVEINVQNNSNTTPALFVINRGQNKVAAMYDGDVNNPGFIVDGNSARPGFVGMGVENPEVRLDIYNSATGTPQSAAAATGTVVHVTQANGANNRLLLDSFGTAAQARPSFTGRHSNGTAAAPSAVQGNDVICEFTGQGYGTSAYSTTSRGRIKINADENWTNTAQGTYIGFDTTPRGTLLTTEVVRISSNGFVGINTQVPNERLTVAGNISASNNLSAVYLHIAPGMNVNYPRTYPNLRASFVSFVDGYAQVNHQNLNSGTSASTDIVLTNNTGTDTTNFVNLGINSSTYSVPAFNIQMPGDAYLYAQNNDLVIGTASNTDIANDLIFHTGGTTTSEERMRITRTGVTTINNVSNAAVSINTAGSGTGTTSIHTNTANTSRISIGNSSAPATINASTLDISTGTLGIAATDFIGLSSANIGIGNSSGNTLNIGNASGNVNLASNGLTITTAGVVNLNTTTGRTTNINTGSGSTTTSIGNSNGTVIFRGNITGSGVMSLNATSTTNNVNINTASSTSSGTTNIHTGAITGALNLGNTGATTNVVGNSVNINGPLATLAPISVNGVVDISNTTTNSIICTASSLLTLPSASTYSGRWLFLKATGNFSITSPTSSVISFNGTGPGTNILSPATNGRWGNLQSDGSNWVVMAGGAFS